jgi:hypothetical protein
MILGTRNYAQNDIRILDICYADWLVRGYVLKTVTANITPTTGIQSTVGTITLSPSEHMAFITVKCGAVNETFTLNVIATDSFGQTVNDIVTINVVAPGSSQ